MKEQNENGEVRRLVIGQNIRKWRELRGIKQQTLARELGITKAALSNIENDKTSVNLRRIEDIARCLGLECMDLSSNPLDLLMPKKQRR